MNRTARMPQPAGARRLPAFALGLALLALVACRSVPVPEAGANNRSTPLPGNTEGDAHKRAQVRMTLAANYYQQGQLQTGMDEVRHAIEIDPGLADAYGLLGLIQSDLGQPVEAQASFERGLALAPTDPELANNYGWFLCRTGRARESIPYFDRAAANRLYQTPAMALQDAGICLRQLKDDKAAERYLLRALESDATSPVAKFQLAELYLARRQFDRADFYYDLLARSVEANAESTWLGARIAHAKGDERQARRLGELLTGRYPDSTQAAALRQGHWDE